MPICASRKRVEPCIAPGKLPADSCRMHGNANKLGHLGMTVTHIAIEPKSSPEFV